jgi:hypothetical protein
MKGRSEHMRKETNEALNAIVKDLTELPGGTDVQISMHAMELISAITGTESDLKDCVNELCLKCGAYHESYLGACDGCRWKAVKEGFR